MAYQKRQNPDAIKGVHQCVSSCLNWPTVFAKIGKRGRDETQAVLFKQNRSPESQTDQSSSRYNRFLEKKRYEVNTLTEQSWGKIHPPFSRIRVPN